MSAVEHFFKFILVSYGHLLKFRLVTKKIIIMENIIKLIIKYKKTSLLVPRTFATFILFLGQGAICNHVPNFVVGFRRKVPL